MPTIKSAKKTILQDRKRTFTNKIKKSQMRTWLRKLREAVAAGNKAEAEALLPTVYQKIDKAAKGNCIHKNQAARKKSQALRSVQGLS